MNVNKLTVNEINAIRFALGATITEAEGLHCVMLVRETNGFKLQPKVQRDLVIKLNNELLRSK